MYKNSGFAFKQQICVGKQIIVEIINNKMQKLVLNIEKCSKNYIKKFGKTKLRGEESKFF